MERTRGNSKDVTQAALAFSAIPMDTLRQETLQEIAPATKGFRLQYEHPHGCIYQGNSLAWLPSLDSASVDLVFADPPYNIKKADWDNFDSQEEYIHWSIQWIRQASRVLKPTRGTGERAWLPGSYIRL